MKELIGSKKGVSIEAMPPFIKDGVIHSICIGINYDKRVISISHHSNLVDETDKEKLRNPSDSTMVLFPFDSLMWLSPRLDGCRQFLGIENGFDRFLKKDSINQDKNNNLKYFTEGGTPIESVYKENPKIEKIISWGGGNKDTMFYYIGVLLKDGSEKQFSSNTDILDVIKQADDYLKEIE